MRVTTKLDKATGRWTGYVNGERISGGWMDRTTARHKARETVAARGKGGVFGGGYVKRGK